MASKLNCCEKFRISLRGTCLLLRRRPVCRWHDLHMGFNKELGNLSCGCQGKRSSMGIQELISDATHRGGLAGSSVEAAVMAVERSGQVIQSHCIDQLSN